MADDSKVAKPRTTKEWQAIKKPGYHADGGGLYLSIVGNSRTWQFRYKKGGKGHWMGLGPDSLVSLAAARDAAIDARRLLRAGIDPIEHKRGLAKEKAAESTPAKTFEAVATEYVAAHKAEWRNEKHAGQWTATLETYIYSVCGQTPVNRITVDDVLECLTPIWETKPETASRVRGRMENVLDYAKTRGWRSGENPARWKGHLDHLLPATAKIAQVVHHAALPWADMPEVMGKLAKANGTGALCLRFTILTAARSGEARAARWNEIDLKHVLRVKDGHRERLTLCPIWTVPGEKMKAGREHRVPLSPAAVAILETMAPLKKDDTNLVFPGARKGKPLSDVSVSKALAGVAKGVTVHGCRSTFRDWAAESTSYPREIAEAALAHANPDKTEAAYQRSDLLEKRARLMREWAKHCTSPAGERDKVTAIRKRA